MQRRKKLTKKEVIDGYRRLAFGDIQSAVRLLFESDEEVLSHLGQYELFNVSEIKKQKGGGMEIKLFDRLKALEKLSELAGAEEIKKQSSIFDAIEKSAVMSAGDDDAE